jgi:hypothetical protein
MGLLPLATGFREAGANRTEKTLVTPKFLGPPRSCRACAVGNATCRPGVGCQLAGPPTTSAPQWEGRKQSQVTAGPRASWTAEGSSPLTCPSWLSWGGCWVGGKTKLQSTSGVLK